jgi:SAM-dependent methyltransferase
MAEYDESTYGERIAEVYDAFVGVPRNADAVVDFLAGVAAGRRALELGVGTGRIALPLAARGIRVAGIDASPKMVAKLRDKSGGDAIPIIIGNFADVNVRGEFSLIYVVFNTFFALLNQEEQVRCFQRVARHLSRDGVFVIEAFVPDVARFDRGQRTGTLQVTADRVVIEATQHNPAAQRLDSAHIVATEEGVKIFPVQLRYAYPSEIDLMARLAGMRLRERFGGWNREPFTAQSGSHVSVYELVAAPAPKPELRRRVKASQAAARRGR